MNDLLPSFFVSIFVLYTASPYFPSDFMTVTVCSVHVYFLTLLKTWSMTNFQNQKMYQSNSTQLTSLIAEIINKLS